VNQLPTYRCPNCERELAAEFFYPNRTNRYRPVQSWCAACVRRDRRTEWQALRHLRKLHAGDYHALRARYQAAADAEGLPEPVIPGRRVA
jgi:hypothetical protein